MRNQIKIIIAILVLLSLSSLVLSSSDEYKPYLHKANVPEHPNLKLYSTYKTNLFPGSATYTYSIELPKGTNGLTPSLEITYNSQSAKQKPGLLGSGWQLTQNFIYRDVNATVNDTSNDIFKLVLRGIQYELVYFYDNQYHTKIESYLKIQNLSSAPNTKGSYWVVTLEDGTQYRFGHNPDSELLSNSGYNYTVKWSIDLIEDTHENKIFYSYLEDPFSGDLGAVYLDEISYNNDKERKIEFDYESRVDYRLVFEQGNKLNETRRLANITILAEGNTVRNYRFNFTALNAENTISGLSSIERFGSDNISLLHIVKFEYYSDAKGYALYNDSSYAPQELFTDTQSTDFGVRLIDFNNDGFIDIVKGSPSEKKFFINNRLNNWTNVTFWQLPVDIVDGSNLDNGVRFEDVNKDGYVDILHAKEQGNIKKVYLNNGTGWVETPQWAPPLYFINSNVDAGVQFIDFNGDGWIDILVAGNNINQSYLNNGYGWNNVSSQWKSSVQFINSDGKDTGARILDVNGDGLPDVINNNIAWLNNGIGWINYTAYISPVAFSDGSTDSGVRITDVNSDGLPDLLENFVNGTQSSKGAWINTGRGWIANSQWQSPTSFVQDNKNIGRRLADVNGDGFADIVVAYGNGSGTQKFTYIKNSTTAYLLKRITNEYGGVIEIDYSRSTSFNNSNNGTSTLGFNLWVVSNVTQNNSLTGDFNAVGNYSYIYLGGKYDYNTSEFAGFGVVNETTPAGTIITHYFHQSEALRGKEFKMEVYNSSDALISRDENSFNFTLDNVYRVFLISSASYIYGGSNSSKATNITYSYDNFGNVKTKSYLGDVDFIGDEKNETFVYVYNTDKHILDKVMAYSLFDSNNELTRRTRYSYDGKIHGGMPVKGDITKLQEWNNKGEDTVTQFEYDNFGNLVKQINPLNQETKYIYGLRDGTFTYLDRIINAKGHQIDFEYDLVTGNLLWAEQNEIRTNFVYDVHGRITKEIQPYDSFDLPTKEYEYSITGTSPSIINISQRETSNNYVITTFYYDGFANLVQLKTKIEDSNAVTKNFFYDGSWRVSSEQNPYIETFRGALSTPSNTTNKTFYTYDALDRVIKVTIPDGTSIQTDFNQWVISDFDANGNKHDYYLDAYGRITNVIEHNVNPYSLYPEIYNTSYFYDNNDNLIKIIDDVGNEFKFFYDSLGRKIKLVDLDIGTWIYSYDVAGNLIAQSGGGGNLVSGDGFYREYDGFGQLAKIRNGTNSSSALLEEYGYDPYGERVKIKRYDSANTTIYTPFKELMQIRNSSGVYDYIYVYLDGVLVSRLNPDGTKWFYHPDHLGSTNLITDQNGNPIANYSYAPYGELVGNVVENTSYMPFGLVLSGGESESKLYTGQFSDELTDQYYYGSRYYKPSFSKFIQCDKIKPDIYNPQALNCYSYGFNNPYRYKDDSGNTPWDVVDVGLFALDIKAYEEEPNLINAISLGVSAVSLTPLLPNVLGYVKHGAKAVDKAKDAVQVVDKASEVAKNAEKVGDTTKAVEKATDTTQIGTKVVKEVAEEIAEISMKDLPQEAQKTIKLIEKGGPFPYPKQDASIFRNDKLRLPQQKSGYYKEYTVPTPGLKNRGTQRIVTGKKGERYYTSDHYKSFKKVTKTYGKK